MVGAGRGQGHAVDVDLDSIIVKTVYYRQTRYAACAVQADAGCIFQQFGGIADGRAFTGEYIRFHFRRAQGIEVRELAGDDYFFQYYGIFLWLLLNGLDSHCRSC